MTLVSLDARLFYVALYIMQKCLCNESGYEIMVVVGVMVVV